MINELKMNMIYQINNNIVNLENKIKNELTTNLNRCKIDYLSNDITNQ